MERVVTVPLKKVSVTEFKAHCLEIISDLEAGRLPRVQLTKRGRVVAELSRPKAKPGKARSLYGWQKGSVTIAPGVDLTEPWIDEFEPEKDVF